MTRSPLFPLRLRNSADPVAGGLGLALLASLALLVSACGAAAIRPEADLFREGSLAFEEESYNSAIEDYKVLLEQYPFSEKAEIASLNIAHAYFLTGEFSTAVDAFNDFERLYPVSPLLPFVGYTIGMCYLEQSRPQDRDASPSESALRQFEKLRHQFPASLWADLAKYRAGQARESLGEHELFVGDYYRKRKRFDSAVARYQFRIAQYPDTQAAARATERLAATLAAQQLSPQEPAQEEQSHAVYSAPVMPVPGLGQVHH